jgi:hypothetical protein
MYWYNLDLGPDFPIRVASEVIDEGGMGPCLDQSHIKSSPWSNNPLSATGRCPMWIRSLQSGLVLHQNHLGTI